MKAYGLNWPAGTDALSAEFAFIRAGGYIEHGGKRYGEGLFSHYRAAQQILWSEDDAHRWSDLILKTILDERITVIQGCRDSSKTRTVSKYALLDYFIFPQETLILMSSTDTRGLEMRVWGDIKDLHRRALEKFPYLSGNPIDAKHGIFTDMLDETGDVRDMRKGIICVPVLDSEGNETKSLEKFIGAKQKRRRLIADEAQFLSINYLKILSNLDKGDFKGVFMGNPMGQGALDKIAEPEGGWETIAEPEKTTTWRNKFDGITISLVGTDSPNFDPDRPKHYPYLVDADDVAKVLKRYGPDSIEFFSQIKGVRKVGLNAHLVLTAEMCQRNHAFDKCLWGHGKITKVMGIDAGYGGDACETIILEFGDDSTGNPVVRFTEPEMIPISLNSPMTPEDQIAVAAKARCDAYGIPPANVGFEAGMRATLAISFARIFSSAVNAILAGGPASERPVSNDLFIDDEETGQRRLKRCDEHYVKRITEMWFAVRVGVECGQVREMPQSVVKEFSEREWTWATQNRYELETKEDFKQRNGYSPNKADAAAIAMEMALRLGLRLARLDVADGPGDDFFDEDARKYRELIQGALLNHGH